MVDGDDAARLLKIGRRLTSNLDLEPLLREITEAAREVTGAKYAALGVLNPAHDELDRFITVGIDAEERERIGDLPRGRGVLGVLINHPHPLRLARISDHADAFGFPPNHPEMTTFLGVPVMIDGVAYGNLYLTEKAEGEFDERDEEAVLTLAGWAAIAIRNAHSVRDDRLRAAIDGSERERRRWARELHDETLQGLGGLHVLLSSALRRDNPELLEAAAREGSEQLLVEIANLRSLITELRPAALDELGLMTALSGLVRRISSVSDVRVELIDALDEAEEFSDEMQTTIYRIVQEALNNAVKHAAPSCIWVSISRTGTSVTASVRDDGVGFDPVQGAAGFGITGMRERAALAHGSLEIVSSPDGDTVVIATLPVRPTDRVSMA